MRGRSVPLASLSAKKAWLIQKVLLRPLTYLDSIHCCHAQEIFSRYGYILSFALEKEQQSTDAVIIDIQPLVSPGGLKRLAFLRVAFALYGINRKALAEALDLNLAGVNRWFRVDDIAISYIFEIAELYGLKVRITATPKNKATQLA